MQQFFHGLVLSVGLLGAIAWACDASQVGDQRPVQRIRWDVTVLPKEHVQLMRWAADRISIKLARVSLRPSLPN